MQHKDAEEKKEIDLERSARGNSRCGDMVRKISRADNLSYCFGWTDRGDNADVNIQSEGQVENM